MSEYPPKIVQLPLKLHERSLLRRALDLLEDSCLKPTTLTDLSLVIDEIRNLRKKIQRYENITYKKANRGGEE